MSKAFVQLVVALSFAFLSAVLDGWVLTNLWGWFVMPLFALPALGIAQAVGLSVVVPALCGVSHLSASKALRQPDKGWEGMAESIAISLLTPLFILATGWVAHLFL